MFYLIELVLSIEESLNFFACGNSHSLLVRAGIGTPYNGIFDFEEWSYAKRRKSCQDFLVMVQKRLPLQFEGEQMI